MRALGQLLYREKPTIITFNYDTMTEGSIESASGLRGRYPSSMMRSPSLSAQISEEEIAFSHHNWNRPLGYGIRFNLVQLHRAGVGTYVDGERFYANKDNELYDRELLKLHGSINWFRFLPFRALPSLNGTDKFPAWMEKAVIHVESHWWMNRPPDFEGWLKDPILITPVLDKEELFNDPLYSRVFDPLWKKAADALATCRKLAIIGYSFSPTDFRSKRLFLEALSSSKLEELIIVNRNGTVVEATKEICHFKQPTVFPDLESYLKSVREKIPGFLVSLSNEELEARFQDGRRVVRALDDAGWGLTGAFWFVLPPPLGWTLFLVSRTIDSERTGEAMSKVVTICSSLKPPLGIDPLSFMIVSPSNSLVTNMGSLVSTGPASTTIGGIRFTQSVFNGLSIEDSYIYRLE